MFTKQILDTISDPLIAHSKIRICRTLTKHRTVNTLVGKILLLVFVVGWLCCGVTFILVDLVKGGGGGGEIEKVSCVRGKGELGLASR